MTYPNGAENVAHATHHVRIHPVRWFFVTIALIICLAASPVTFVVLGARVSATATAACAAVNRVNAHVRDTVDSGFERATRATRALLASPTATPAEKKAARENLAAGAAFVAKTNHEFRQDSCQR